MLSNERSITCVEGEQCVVFWDSVAGLYDLFEDIYNKKVYWETGQKVAERLRKTDVVLECACDIAIITKKTQQEEDK